MTFFGSFNLFQPSVTSLESVSLSALGMLATIFIAFPPPGRIARLTLYYGNKQVMFYMIFPSQVMFLPEWCFRSGLARKSLFDLDLILPVRDYLTFGPTYWAIYVCFRTP